ncbi:MAG: ferric reductase-like transmembrane domain-containing protein [Acidimicrobiales bacterium]
MSSIDLWYATRATGLAAMVLMTATVVLGLVTARRAGSTTWPRFIQQDLHKRISLLTVVFLAIHILTSVLDSYVHIGWAAIAIPFTSPYDRFYVGLGAIALDLMVAVVVSSLLRPHINAKVWRAIHWLAYGSWPVAMAHSIGTGTDMRLGWVDGLVGLCCLAVVSAAVWRFAGSAIAGRGTPVRDPIPTELALNGRAK